MSNGGYKGASPARETSPEHYPGVWELTEQFQAQADGNWPFQETDCAPKSIRFNAADSSNLSKTFSGSSSTTFTLSYWIKRSKLGAWQYMWSQSDGSSICGVAWSSNDRISLYNGSHNFTTAFFRDVSAWYHLCLKVSGGSATLYVNGTQVVTAGNFFLGASTAQIGMFVGGGSYGDNSYIADFQAVDGQALNPTEFAFYDGQGLWMPKRFTGDYSSGPVYSNLVTGAHDTNHGWGTTYQTAHMFDGSLTTMAIGQANDTGLTFTPSSPLGANATTIRIYGMDDACPDSHLKINGINYGGLVNSGTGWTVLKGTGAVGSGISSIESIYLRDNSAGNQSYRFAALEIDGVILTDASVGRNSFHLDFSGGVKDQSGLGNDWTANNIDAGTPRIETTGDITLSSQNRNFFFKGAVGHSIGVAVGNHVWDSADGVSWSYRGQSGASVTLTTAYVEISGTTNIAFTNTNSDSVVYWDAALGHGLPNGSGSGSAETFDVEANGSDGADKFVDSPVNGNEASTGAGGERRGNYCCFNLLDKHASISLSDGNLKVQASTSQWELARSTFFLSSGKHYWEFTWTGSVTSSSGYQMGLKTPESTLSASAEQAGSYAFQYTSIYQTAGSLNTVSISPGSTTSGDTVMFAYDADAGKMWIGVNGTWNGSGNPSTGANPDWTNLPKTGLSPFAGCYGNSNTITLNAGQRSFKYTNHSGFSPLATSFLPEPSESAKHPHKGVDVALFNANNGVSQFIPLSFSPDLVWTKSRAGNYEPQIFDKVRGDDQEMSTNVARASRNLAGSFTFNDDGFTLPGSNNNANYGTGASMAWAWDGGEATTSIAAGDSNSSAYDQSQAWSAGMKTSVAATTSYITTGRTTTFDLSFTGKEPFNADLTDFLYGKTGVAGTWIYLEFATALTNVTSIAFSTEYSCPSGIIKLNGTDVSVDKADLAGGFVEVNVTGAIPSSLTEIAIQGVGGSARLKYMKINGKYLIDGINDSQTWSNSLSGLSGSSLTNPPNAFDADESSYADSTAGFTLDLSGHTFGTGAHTIEVKSGGATSFSVNGSTSLTDPGGGGAKVWTGTHTGELTSLASSATGASLYYLKIDGILLVNPGQNFVVNVPTIATTVRSNPSYGFSISKASVAASLTGGPTVAHGLQKKPEFIVGKNIDSTIYWYAYHKDLTNEHYLIPHLTSGEQHSNAVWGNHDSLDANQIQIGAGTPASMWIPSGTHDCIFYAWTSIEGFSKIGSFINPSSSDGAFVFLGFKPALIFAKCAINISSSNNLGDWVVKDSSRSPFNNPSDGNTLIWNEAYSEDGYYSATQVAIDILSNGFKIRHPGSSPLGDPGRRYVFAAWAENPFASNNRAV